VEERKLKDWEKNIQILFGKFPQIEKLIKNPVYHSNTPWAREANAYLLKSTGGLADGDFYRVIFKQGSAKSLMTIVSGELSGLKTSSVVEKGKITAVAGLEPVDAPAASNFLPMLLTMGMFGAIQHRLSYISNICTDIRNHQIVGDYARLERISEVILECFESIPEMDEKMMHLNLARMTSNTDECLDLVIIMREELSKESHTKPEQYRTFDRVNVEGVNQNGERFYYDPVAFVKQMMQHNVFAAYERFVAGKICQIALSGNYSASNIERSKQSVARIKDTIRKIFEARIKAHKEGAKEYESRISEYNDDHDTSGWSLLEWKQALVRQKGSIAEIEAQLYALLDAKLESFDSLSHLVNQDEIDVYLINGEIVINEKELKLSD